MTEETPAEGYSMYGAAMFLAAPEDADTVAFIREMGLRQAHSLALYELDRLWRNLVQREEIVVRAVKSGADAAANLHPSLLIGAKPDFSEHTLIIAGLTYHAIRVFPASETLGPMPVTGAKQASNTGNGGRIPKYDWLAFDAEVVRIGWIEGFKSRKLLNQQMKKWCETHFAEQPDESMISKRVRALCPDDIPAE